jgi:hypothetical protein
MTAYKEGMLVENSKCPHWGPGKIVHISGDNMHVIFRDLEEDMAKLFKMEFQSLRPASVQTDLTLDNLPPLVEKNGRWLLPAKRYTLESLKKSFQHYFPAGFADPKYHDNERTYKMYAHIKFNQMLGIEQMRGLLKAGHVRELATKAISIEARLNLLSVFEKAAFRGGLRNDVTTEAYFTALLKVLDEKVVTESAFTDYLGKLSELPVEGHKVASWPVATLFLYLADPFKHMFLKPEVTKSAAASLGFDLKYDASPNWRTYDALLRLGHTYLDLLRPLGARDFVDVQSFIYVTCGGYEGAIAKKKAATEKERARS